MYAYVWQGSSEKGFALKKDCNLGRVHECRHRLVLLPVVSVYPLFLLQHQDINLNKGGLGPRVEPWRIDEVGVRKQPDACAPPKRTSHHHPLPHSSQAECRFHAVCGGRQRADCVCGGGWEVWGTIERC